MEESYKYQDLLSILNSTLESVGDSRKIICNRGLRFETAVEEKKGFLLGRAWSYQFLEDKFINKLFSVNVLGVSSLTAPYLLIMKRLPNQLREIIPLFGEIAKDNASLLIVTEDIPDEILEVLVVNYSRETIRAIAVRANCDEIVDNFYEINELKPVQVLPINSNGLIKIEEVHLRKYTTVAVLKKDVEITHSQSVAVIKIGGEDYEDQSARLKFVVEWLNNQDRVQYH